MNQILKMYYGIETNQQIGYFCYRDELYYFCYVQDIKKFLDVYRFYCFCMHQCHHQGYTIVKNNNQDIVSQQHVLLQYHQGSFSFPDYLHIFLQPLPYQHISIKDIKESWIQKIDIARECIKDYAYSFKHDQDVISLTYYYCGLAENSINVLNEILRMSSHATIPLSLALSSPINNHVYEIVNPAIYTLSSRCRHIVYLWKSRLLSIEQIKEMIESYYFDVYELIYLYARMLYPSSYFDDLINRRIEANDIQNYYFSLSYERECYKELYYILSYYVSLPKIDWINT